MHEIFKDIDLKKPTYEAWNDETFMVFLHCLTHRKVYMPYNDSEVDAEQDDMDLCRELLIGYVEWNYKTPRKERLRLAKIWSDAKTAEMNKFMEKK